ncbi:hypothetical protein AXG93_1712s1620 [Marchantia polymorpha subsp. ruderalis]|uniref:NADH dehydrogenase [ubiquinone] 1 beta subcomplex subunit 9 n=1 Tax=Marchantia polymorpha subsp. ruderalis TaxID=1480154 RepID=A0A176W0I8_MARPO|nr:hypothetical protein AXG93_1712s1620 [Marchantia polymorpha subsp. ruderalis]
MSPGRTWFAWTWWARAGKGQGREENRREGKGTGTGLGGAVGRVVCWGAGCVERKRVAGERVEIISPVRERDIGIGEDEFGSECSEAGAAARAHSIAVQTLSEADSELGRPPGNFLRRGRLARRGQRLKPTEMWMVIQEDISRIDRLIGEGEAKLEKMRHPDPYTVPWAPGGSKYARSPPVPEEIGLVYDFGRQEEWDK